MSTIREVKEELKMAKQPVARALHHNDEFKVLVVGFNKSMILKKHKAHLPTILTVLEGKVIYKQGEQSTTMHLYDEYNIPVGVLHEVEALKNSLCLLTQGEPLK